MNWGQVGLAALVATVTASLADWFFFGVLFHGRYKAFPEVWRRPQGGAGEAKAVAVSAAAGVLTPLVFVALCAALSILEPGEVLLLAVAVWLIVPVPLLAGQYLFVKLHPLITVAHAAGWLVKLLLCAASVALLMR